MELAALISKFRGALEAKYSQQMLPSHYRALASIQRCRTPAAGEVLTRCADCL